jgi:RNA polymerase sigma factor (sigma-70 family)
MGKGQPGSALRQLRSLFASGTTTGLTDSELLERYTAKRAESAEAASAAEMAFAALVDRHGAMVWGVCHRMLGDAHEAEDAFQATFLVLVRKAGSVRVDGSLGRWLYGVAHRVARRARFAAERRGSGIGRGPANSSDDPAREVETRDLCSAVSEELDRLPAKYRCPVELCQLQGMTYDQAARQLDWPVATVKSRLTKGRLRLRARLARRGLAPAAVAAATALNAQAQAAVPQQLVQSTVQAATSCAASSFSAVVTTLAEGVLKMMMWEKLKLIAAGVLVAVGLTAHALSQQAPKDGILTAQQPQAAVQPAEKPNEKSVDDRRWVRSLPNGATIEIIGVSSYPSGADTWWRPDGTPLHPAPCDRIEPSISSDEGVRMSIVMRRTGIPDGASQDLSIAQSQGYSRGLVTRDGKPIPELDLSEMTGMLPADTGTCTVRFRVAAGPWRTELTVGKSSGAYGTKTASYIFGDAIATKKGTSLAVTHDLKGVDLRLVAVDGDGKDHIGVSRYGYGVKNFQQIGVEFKLPPEQIKEFLLQTRSYQEVEIPGIALKRK